MSRITRCAALVAMTGFVAAPVFAATPAQPDVTDVVAYITGSVATIALVGNASLIVKGAIRVYSWVRSAIR